MEVASYYSKMEKQGILTERNVVVEVLEKYRKLPYLWNPTHKLYTNKNARRQGLEIMLKSWRKLEPNATIECIRKKLNNWRAAYRRERKKVEDSLASSSEPDEIHRPNLWYYEYLTFIHDDCPVLSKDDVDDTTGNEIMSDDNNEDEEGTTESKDVNVIDKDNDGFSDDGGQDEDGDESDEERTEEAPEKKTRISVKRKLDRLPFDSAMINNSNDESSADLFGRAIGSQLKEVSKFQRCLAEKLISEIVFYAKLEQLTIGTSINIDLSES